MVQIFLILVGIILAATVITSIFEDNCEDSE